jgi:hypothetical protein
MANTYTLISSVTLSGTAASISFTSIPATYTDLLIKLSARGDEAGVTWQNVRLRYNSDSGSNYTHAVAAGLGTTTATAANSNTVYTRFSYAPYVLTTASIFSNSEYYFPNYTSGNNKTISYESSAENNDASVYALAFAGGIWSNVAAISSIEITPDAGGNWVQYSTAYLYGISNA